MAAAPILWRSGHTLFYYRTCLCLQYVLCTIHMKVYSEWWQKAMWTSKVLVNELGRLDLGRNLLPVLMWHGKRKCGLSRRVLWEAREQGRVLLQLQREGQVSIESGIQVCWLTVLAFRNGQLFLKARGEKLLLEQRGTSILCTHRKTLHRAEGALSLKGTFYFIILKFNTWDHFSKILSKWNKMLKEKIYFQKNRCNFFF